MPRNRLRPAIIAAAAAFAWAGPVMAAAGEIRDDTLAVLDPGGVAFPWPAPGSWDPQRKTVSGDLLEAGDAEGDPRRSGWRTAVWPRRPDPQRPVGKPVHDVLTGQGRGGGSCFRLLMTSDADQTALSRWTTTINIAAKSPFRVSGWVRAGELLGGLQQQQERPGGGMDAVGTP